MNESPPAPAFARQIETASIRSSQTVHQRELDGWLVRLAPAQAKRSRCINAVGAGSMRLDEKVAACLALYRQAALPPVFRITPFSEPANLDAALAARGWQRFDDALVMRTPPLTPHAPARDAATSTVDLDHDTFAAWTAAMNGWSSADAAELASRLQHGPVVHRNLAVLDAMGEPIAAGQVAVDGALAGLYSIFTKPAHRGNGIGDALCRSLMARGLQEGATSIYLQVELGNDRARRLYEKLGFVTAYVYHYRREPALDGPAG